jgi:acetyl esterase
MPLDPQIAQILLWVEKAGRPAYYEMTPQAARALYEKQAPTLDFKPREMARTWTIRHAHWSALVQVPQVAAGTAPLPVLLFIHGGGFTIGSSTSHLGLTTEFANATPAIIVSLDYRLAPEHKFPSAIDDAYSALQWVMQHAAELGGDPQRIAIGGDSAGGTLALVATLMARDAGLPLPKFQLLIYPGTDGSGSLPSRERLADGYLLSKRTIAWFFSQTLRDEADRADWRFSPLRVPDLSGLPPTWLAVAEFDPLVDEGVALGERLRAAGNQVTLAHYPGQVHGFFNFGGAIKSAKSAVADAVAALQRGFLR